MVESPCVSISDCAETPLDLYVIAIPLIGDHSCTLQTNRTCVHLDSHLNITGRPGVSILYYGDIVRNDLVKAK